MKLENKTNRITKRQIEILELMAKGYKEDDIAKELRISHVLKPSLLASNEI